MTSAPGPMASTVIVVVAVGAAIIDLRTRRLPNRLTASTALVGFALSIAGHQGPTPAAALMGLVVGGLLMAPGYLIGATGAGDVKLLAAFGTLLGPTGIVVAWLGTAVAGGALAAVAAWRSGRLGLTARGVATLARAPYEASAFIATRPVAHRFAYGPAIAVGAIAALWLA